MGHRLNLIATDDTHYPGYDVFRAWTLVHARDRTRAALLDSLAAGRFYATTGPRITSLTLADGLLTVRTTPARTITALGTSYIVRRDPHQITVTLIDGQVAGYGVSGAADRISRTRRRVRAYFWRDDPSHAEADVAALPLADAR